MQQEPLFYKNNHAAIDYQALIDELDIWQSIFELAMEEAAHSLGPQQFPAQDLQALLGDMCDLLRAVLITSHPYTNATEEA